jgi:heme/copper-type cytochrome/quinol oxidase subunit 2
MTARSALFWVAALVCIVAELAILRSLLVGRARAAEQSATGPLSEAIRARRPAEVAWAILPAVGLVFVLYLTWRAVDTPAAPTPDVSHSGVTIGA